ncbi:helix-turn-helix domain-containing protein [Malacoplasma iowae]|uniref:helix-turn-helix domain-containing protein n=1 Tax=Malacoplasma iowae TaxID=2116 RepID=UPI003873628C|nr:helix-turn-helix domain-containing protein [Malacoplasma iowae]WPL35754.1 helix-turn-helix domain-containing protein [Malacoplasma iowae]
MKTYKHLTKEERCLIYFLWNKEKYSMNKIAKILNKNKSTISRELKRNTSSTGIYYSSTAHKKLSYVFYVEVQKLHRSFYSKI